MNASTVGGKAALLLRDRARKRRRLPKNHLPKRIAGAELAAIVTQRSSLVKSTLRPGMVQIRLAGDGGDGNSCAPRWHASLRLDALPATDAIPDMQHASCALVWSEEALRNSGAGSAIDAHAAVFRVVADASGASTGAVEDVGLLEAVRVLSADLTSEVLRGESRAIRALAPGAASRGQPPLLLLDVREAEGLSRLGSLAGALPHYRPGVRHPSLALYHAALWATVGRRTDPPPRCPTDRAVALLLATLSCSRVDVYGTSDACGRGEASSECELLRLAAEAGMACVA